MYNIARKDLVITYNSEQETFLQHQINNISDQIRSNQLPTINNLQ